MSVSTFEVRSSSGKGIAVSVACLLAGLLFLWLTAKIPVHDSNTAAAMWLGVLLTGLGVAGLIVSEEVVTTVDTVRRCVEIDRTRRWGSRKTSVPFDEVASVNVARVGSRSGGTPSFWLQIERADGQVISTGRWSMNEAETRQLAERLSARIGCECRGGKPLSPASLVHVVAAAIGAVVLYAGWFRFSVGPWCPAMWFGTAPPVFILAGFAVLLGLLRRFS